MRIIAGRFKGIRLPAPRGKAIRPTTERVREAIFDVLGSTVDGSRILELFAGTGAFGLEAVSRGAAYVVFVEKDNKLTRTLAELTRALEIQPHVLVLTMSATQALKSLAANYDPFSMIYLDPPYGTDWIEQVVNYPDFGSLLTAEGIVIVERDARSSEPVYPDFLRKRFSRQYGDTLVDIFDRYAISQ
jgi:16S rRNA (guanine966-N2)-methyltransferase